MKQPLSPPDWTNPFLVVIRQTGSGWEVSKPNASHGIRVIETHASLETAREQAEQLAKQLSLSVVEYDRDKRKLRDTRPTSVRLKLTISRVTLLFMPLKKFAWWASVAVLTAIIGLTVESAYKAITESSVTAKQQATEQAQPTTHK